MDSQLLSCASMLSGDLFPGRKGDGTRGEGGKRAAAAGLALGALAWLVSLRPPEAMLAFLNRAAFPGYAILAPVALAALYAPAVGAGSAMAALVAGAILVAAQAAGLFAPPIPAVFFNAGVQVAVLAFGWLLARGNRGWGGIAVLRKPFSAKWAITFGVFLVAGLELWSFGNTWSEAAGAFGLPRWVWYQALLVLGLGAAFIAFGRTGGRLAARTGPRPSDQ